MRSIKRALAAASIVALAGWWLPAGPASAAGPIALGTQTVGANPDSDAAGSAEAFPATAVASGSIASITVYVDSSNAASQLVVGLYADGAGNPGTLLTQGSVSSPAAAAWNTVAVPAATVVSGTRYWITVLSPAGAGGLDFRDAASGSLSENSSQSNLTALPGTWSPGNGWNNSPISAYATLAPTGPALSVSPAALTFGATVGGADPPASTVSVANIGSGSLTYSATSDSAWLSVAPATGTAPQTLALSASITGLAAGTYTGHVTVTASGAQGSPQVTTATLVLNNPVTPGQGDWPTIEHDASRSGMATDETKLAAANAGSLIQAWSTKLDGKVTAQPLYLSGVQVAGASHDVVIAATNQDSLYAIDSTTGVVLWHRQLTTPAANCTVPGGFGIQATPVVDRTTGRVYAMTDDGDFRTVFLADGSEAAPPLPVISDPVHNVVWGALTLVNGNVYFPTGSDGCDTAPWQGGIYEIAVTGNSPQLVKHWITVPTLPASTAGGGIWGYGGVSYDPAVNHLYAASADDATGLTGKEGYTPYSGSMLALDSNLNLLGWYQPPQPPNYNCGSAPPCDQDFASTPLVFHPSGCPTMLAAGNKNGNLYVTPEPSLETNGGADGTHVQSIQLDVTIDDLGLGGLYGTPAYSPTTNLLYVTDSGPGIPGVAGGLAALAVQPDCSLKVAWSVAVGGSVSNSPNSTPTIADGVVYVGVNDGSVSAFDAGTGSKLWNSGSNGFAVYAAPVVANGRLIAGSWDSVSGAGSIRAWVPSKPLGLAVNPTSLSFTAVASGVNPASQTVSLTNTGSSPLTFTAGANQTWLGVAPLSGAVPNTLTVEPTIAGLATGMYTGTVTVTPSAGTPQTVAVNLAITPPPTAPGAPTAVTATPGNQSAVVSWVAPPDGGSAITTYTITPFTGGVAQTVTTVTGAPPATTATLSGLTNGIAYTFTVSATNSVGAGPASVASSAVTPTAVVPPTVDVKVSAQGNATTLSTAAFSTAQAGEVILAFVSADGPAASGAQSATVSGAGLTWSFVGRANTRFGSAEVWSATAAAKLTNVTVSSTLSARGYNQLLTVIAFEGSSGVGAFKAASATSGGASASVTTTHAGSLIYGVAEDWDTATAPTVGAGQAIVNEWVDTGTGTTFWVQDQISPAGVAGSTATINDTAPSGDQWDLLVVEVRGS